MCWSDLNCLRTTIHNQPTPVVPEIPVDAPPQASTVGADPGGTTVQKDKGQPSVPPVVCTHIVSCTSSA